MSFYFKTPKAREIHHPNDEPNRDEMVNKGIARWNRGEMKFENEAQKNDYIRRVNANKFNILGYPAWYPEEKIVSVGNMTDHDCKQWGHRWTATAEKVCIYCGKDKEEIERMQAVA